MIVGKQSLMKRTSIILVSCFLLTILTFFHMKGIVYYDEGYIVNSGLKIAHGEIPYRDFDVVYTPLSFVTTAAFLKLFGESVLAGRLAALSISALSLFALYKILKKITKNSFVTILSLLFFIAWGPAHINFPWPVMFAICFFLYTIFFYIVGFQQKNKKYFFLMGMMVFMIFLSKQNFGTIIFVASFFTFIFVKLENKKVYIAYYTLGAVVLSSIFIITLIKTSSLSQFFQNMNIYTFERVLIQKTLDTAFVYEGNLLIKFGKTIFYILPFVLSLIAFSETFKSRKKLFVIPVFTALFYIVGIRPTTDYNHLAPLLSISCLSLVIIINQQRAIVSKIFIALLIFMVALGFYRAYFNGYYKWDAPLYSQTYFVKNPRFFVYMSKQEAKDTIQLITYIKNYTNSNDYIFINYYSPLIYFLADRKNSSRYDLVSPNDLPLSYQKAVISTLKEKKVKLVIMHFLNKNEKSLIADYVKKNYPIRKNIRGYIIFTKVVSMPAP